VSYVMHTQLDLTSAALWMVRLLSPRNFIDQCLNDWLKSLEWFSVGKACGVCKFFPLLKWHGQRLQETSQFRLVATETSQSRPIATTEKPDADLPTLRSYFRIDSDRHLV
jgi:hypothetical protein